MDHDVDRLRARISALEDLVGHLLLRTGTPLELVAAWRRAGQQELDYGIRGAANEIIAKDRGLPSPLDGRR